MPTPTPSPFSGLLSPTDPLVQWLISGIRGLLVLLVALVLARIIRRWVVRLFARNNTNLNMAALLGNLAQVLVVLVGIVLMLPSFGVDWAGLLTLLGALGLAISLSMQDLLKNVIAGIYMLMEQPFRIGDRISVKDVTGVVQGIELRTTVLRTDEDLQVVVPNSVVLNEIVTNRSASNLQRQIITIRLPKGSLSEISRQISDALKEFPEIATTPAPVVALEQIFHGVARLRIQFWMPAGTPIALTPQIVEALQQRFPDANVTIA